MIAQSTTSASPSLATQHAEATKRLSELSNSRQGDGATSEELGGTAEPEIGSLRSGSASGSVINVLDVEAQLTAAKTAFDAKLAAFDARKVAMKAEVAVNGAEMGLRSVDFRNDMRERVAFLEDVEPVPARVLEGEEAEKTLRMLEAFEVGDVVMGVSETGRRAWTVDDLSYVLDPDGTLSVSEAGVPRTEADRIEWLESSKRTLATYEQITKGKSKAELQLGVETARSAFDAAQANADRLAAEAEKASQFRTLDITA